MLEDILGNIVADKKAEGVSKNVLLNYLREYVQYLVLELIYNKKEFKEMVFKGGSCLRICYDLPRLSEDLDFDWRGNLNNLESFLGKEIKSKYYPKLETKIQGERRIYFKFPVLNEIGVASGSESDRLYVKVEVDEKVYKNAKDELTPVSEFGFNFVARHYDLPSLMAGNVYKSRDFYDLYWFLKNNVKPNWKMLKEVTGIKSEAELKRELLKRIEVVTPEKISYDLKNFIAEKEFVRKFSRNYVGMIEKML